MSALEHATSVYLGCFRCNHVWAIPDPAEVDGSWPNRCENCGSHFHLFGGWEDAGRVHDALEQNREELGL